MEWLDYLHKDIKIIHWNLNSDNIVVKDKKVTINNFNDSIF